MSPDQIERWLKFSDIVLNDNTSATNQYEMALSLFLVVDNHLSSRLVVQALTDDETRKAHTGMSSMSRVESYNSKVKKLVFNSNTSLLELIEKLTVCIVEKDKKTEYALFRASVPKTALIQKDQIKQSLQYHATIVVPNEIERYFSVSKGLTDITARAMLNFVDKNKIVEMWGVRQVMLCTRNATFHIQLIWSRWFNKTSDDPKQEPFIVTSKFEIEQPLMINWDGPILYLNVLIQDSMHEVQDINHKTIEERILYGKAWGKARAALMVAVRRRDYNFINILDRYLKDCHEEPEELSSSNESEESSNKKVEVDSETTREKLNPKELVNPYKHKGKGQPKGTDRMRRANEAPQKMKRKLHCKICGVLVIIEQLARKDINNDSYILAIKVLYRRVSCYIVCSSTL
ncbi:hypothetical protein C2G38_2246787 [Gigaspora rosea]|uniref:Uncharacterized protein n=1 Tax=Gigaspora rosea TaxID=44941 RepID=A0A397V598_9GLOM|nr:hypothetical protein C2G38_2246787 [Gigaspora rosea]